MNGYTMEDAQRIIGYAEVRVAGLCTSDPDYPALLEIYRRYIRGEHPMLLASSAFALGHAIGVRDERARRSGMYVNHANPGAVEQAEQAVDRVSMEHEFKCLLKSIDTTKKKAVLSTLKKLAAGADSAEAFRAGDAVLQAAERPLVADG